MTLEAVFIDAGNTLLYEKPSRFEIYAQAARRRGLDVDSGSMRELMRRAHQELPQEIGGAFRYSEAWFTSYIRTIFHDALGLSSKELPAISEELFGRFADPSTFALFPGATELLAGFRARGLRVGIVSNWSPRLPAILDGLGVSPRIDFALVSAIERVEKPSPEIFERACARAGVDPCSALHAGDHLERDVAGARSAGLRAVQVDHTGSTHRKNVPSEATDGSCVGSLPELADLIARML